MGQLTFFQDDMSKMKRQTHLTVEACSEAFKESDGNNICESSWGIHVVMDVVESKKQAVQSPLVLA